MAIVVKGIYKDCEAAIIGFCNNWFQVEITGPRGLVCKIVNPSNLTFTETEVSRIEAARGQDDTGFMFTIFEWDANGTRLLRIERYKIRRGGPKKKERL